MHWWHFLSPSLSTCLFISFCTYFFYKHNPTRKMHFEASFTGDVFYHIHNSTTNRSWNESSVMRFDQTLELNETWRELARGPMRDDSADSSREKHLVRPSPPFLPHLLLLLPASASALLGHMPPAQVCFHRAQCPVAAIKLGGPRFASANTYGPG